MQDPGVSVQVLGWEEVIGGGKGAEGIQRVEEPQPESVGPDSSDAAD